MAAFAQDLAALRATLVQQRDYRAELVALGAATPEALAVAHLAVQAVEAAMAPRATAVDGRVVIMDVPGKPLGVALIGAAGQLAAVEIEPLDLLALAVDAITSGRRRLAGGAL